jgi:Tol biopolymer transport system component/DNA-binding winged helix-turn-helix (wHTH) protein
MLISGQVPSIDAPGRGGIAESRRFLSVGDHVVDFDTLRIVTRDDARLTPKAAGVLRQLVRGGGRTLSRDELLDEVWKGTCPTPDVLTQAVKDLRRALGDDLNAPRFIETVPRLGYRLVAAARFVEHIDDVAPKRPAATLDTAIVSARVPRAPLQRAVVALLALGVLGIAAIAMSIVARTPDVVVAPKPRWHVSDQRAITSDPGPEMFARIAPDGARVAYSIGGKRSAHIVLRTLADSRVARLTEPETGAETQTAWSPDGSTIAFIRHDGDACDILAAPSLGGPERRIASCIPGAVTYFSWSPDGERLLTTMPTSADAEDMAIAVMPIGGGAPQRLGYHHGAADVDLDARYSPDGTRIAFRRGASPYSDLFVVDAHGGDVRQLTHLATRIRGFDWTRDGSALVFSSSHAGASELYTVAIDDARIEALDVEPAEYPSTGRNTDTVVYSIPRVRTQLVQFPLDIDGDLHSNVRAPSTGNDGAPAFSPVDGRLAFVSDRSGSPQLWLDDPEIGVTYALTDGDDPTLLYPVWRPDGAQLVVTARGASSGRLVEVDLATRARRTLTAPDEDVRYGVFGAKPGEYIAVVGDEGGGRALIGFENASGNETSRRVLARDVGRVDYDPAASIVYFTKTIESGLFSLDPSTGVEKLVSPNIMPTHLDGWLVRAGHVFYIEPEADAPSELHDLDPDSGDDRVVATIGEAMSDFNFSVSNDLRAIVVARTAAEDTDVGAITLKRVAQK